MKRTTRKSKMGKRNRGMIGGGRGWIAAGTLAAYAAMGGTRTAIAAVEKLDPAAAGAAEATLPLKKFDIPAGPLEAAVKAYEQVTGLTVKIVLPAGTVAGFNSKGVVGLYREDEALRLLLEGTGLNYRVEDATTMLVGVQSRDTVSVTEAITDAISLSKFTEPLLNTPQSVTVVPEFVMKDEAVTTLRDALRNVPGISLAAGEAGGTRRQPDHSRIHRQERHLPRRNSRLRKLLSGLVQLRAGRGSGRTSRSSVWTRGQPAAWSIRRASSRP